MANSRLTLHEKILQLTGIKNVYFNPPENVKMQYPCFVYRRTGIKQLRANDVAYVTNQQFNVLYIHKDPDDTTGDRLLMLEHCSYDRGYIFDNLYHDSYTVYI